MSIMRYGAPFPNNDVQQKQADAQELKLLRDLECDIRQAWQNALGHENFSAVVSAALDRFDRKRGAK